MNQSSCRLIKRKCVIFEQEVLVRQIYNPHNSDWDDVDPWICDGCLKKCQQAIRWESKE